ncbi:MAG: alpha-ketoglutarate-dependent dioxygenase AlkB [Proteobacteria bacterium]|nr:alpha-ketoglutarate-dependent dioxygenase AlkB [Pseudomonadota bacterium]
MNTAALLFDEGPLTLVDDREGGIRYWPQWIDSAEADDLFARLRDGVSWLSEQRPMYDRIVDVPRLQATVALATADPDDGLRQIASRIETAALGGYSHVGLNFYRDGHDSVAMHHDRTHDLVIGAPIAILSLGAPRDMLIRRQDKGARAVRITLEPSSLLVMSHASQFTHEHGIPKTSRSVGPRISCAYRARQINRVVV